MELLSNLLDIVMRGLPGAASALCSEHIKNQALARLKDLNPFGTIPDSPDLVRATRIAWIEAALEVLRQGQALSEQREWHEQEAVILKFNETIKPILIGTRDHALDRRKDPGTSPIDVHVQDVIVSVPELVAAGDHAGIGADVNAGLSSTLAQLSGWSEYEIPKIYQQIAVGGLRIHGGVRCRRFGELVIAAFAEMIKNPKMYPQASKDFDIVMGEIGRDIGRKTLNSLHNIDDRLNDLIKEVDALEVFCKGANNYLELLPEIAGRIASADDMLNKRAERDAAQMKQAIGKMFRIRGSAAHDDAAVSAFHYTLARDPFVGRADFIRRIETELLDYRPDGEMYPKFLWMALCGEGGTGKSRLAQEIIIRNKSVWVHSGFVESEFLKKTAQVYEIGDSLDGPLFMVVDYAVAERATVDLLSFMRAWMDYSRGAKSHPVRVMIITRREKETLLQELRGKGISPNRNHVGAEEIESSPAVLKHLERSDALALMRARIHLTAEHTNTLPVEIDEDALIDALDRFDDRRRPLFAAMVAAEIQSGTLPDRDTSQESNRLSLFGQYLERQERNHWLPQARDLREDDAHKAVRRHANLVRLATCCGDVGVQLVRSLVPEEVGKGLGDFPELSVTERPGAIRAPIISVMTGENPRDDSEAPCDVLMPQPKIIPRLEPDLIGERFFLMTAEEADAEESWSRAEALAGLSWVCAPESTAAFLRMATQDYPERMHALRWLPPRPIEQSPKVLRARVKMLRNVCSDIATRYGRATISAKDLERLFDIIDQFDEGMVALVEADTECREHYGQILRQVANIAGRLANASLPFRDPINAVEDEENAPERRSDIARAFAQSGVGDSGGGGRLDSEDSIQPLPPALAAILVKRMPPLLDRAGRFLLKPGPILERQPFMQAFADVMGAVHFRHRHEPNLGGRWPEPRDNASEAVLKDWRGRVDNLHQGDIDDVTILAGVVSIFVYADYENSTDYSNIYPAIERALGLVDRIRPNSAATICSMLGNALVLKNDEEDLSAEQRKHIADSIGIYLQLAVLVDFAEDVSLKQVQSALRNFFTTGFNVLLHGQRVADTRLAEAIAALARLLAMSPKDTPLPADFLSVLAHLPVNLSIEVSQAFHEAFQTRFLSGAIDVDDFLSPNKQNLAYFLRQLIFGVPEPRLRLPNDIARALLQMLGAKVGAKAIRAALESIPQTLETSAEVRVQVPLNLAREYVDGLRQQQGFDARDYVAAAKLAIWGHDILDGRIDLVQSEIAVLWDATNEPFASRGHGLALWGVALVFDATRAPNDFTDRWAGWLRDADLLETGSDRQRLLGIGFGEKEAEEYIRDYNLALVDACMAAARLHIVNGGNAAEWIQEPLS
jgi:hypothetical protein